MTVSWDPPSVTLRNGVITGYYFICTPNTGLESVAAQYIQNGIFRLQLFTPATTYICSIFAFNNQGNGPAASPTIIRTLEDCKPPYPFADDGVCTYIVET